MATTLLATHARLQCASTSAWNLNICCFLPPPGTFTLSGASSITSSGSGRSGGCNSLRVWKLCFSEGPFLRTACGHEWEELWCLSLH